MRKNRKRRNAKLTQAGRDVLKWFFAFLLIGVVQCILYLSVGNSSRGIMKDINGLEQKQQGIKKDLSRQQALWADCMTPDKLEQSIVLHGLDMEQASGEQIVSLRGKRGSGRTINGPSAYASNRRRP